MQGSTYLIIPSYYFSNHSSVLIMRPSQHCGAVPIVATQSCNLGDVGDSDTGGGITRTELNT
jgi:hypothetical protein